METDDVKGHKRQRQEEHDDDKDNENSETGVEKAKKQKKKKKEKKKMNKASPAALIFVQAVDTHASHFPALLALDQRFMNSDLTAEVFDKAVTNDLKANQPVLPRASLKGTKIYASLLRHETAPLYWKYKTAWDPVDKVARGYCRYLHDVDKALVYVSWIVAPGVGRVFWEALAAAEWKSAIVELFVSVHEREVDGDALLSSERGMRRLNFFYSLGFKTQRIEWPFVMEEKDSTGTVVRAHSQSNFLFYMVLWRLQTTTHKDAQQTAVELKQDTPTGSNSSSTIVIHIDGVPGSGKSWLCREITEDAAPDSVVCVDTDDLVREAYWLARQQSQKQQPWEDFHDRMAAELTQAEDRLINESKRRGQVLVLAGINHRAMSLTRKATHKYFIEVPHADLQAIYRRLLQREYNKIIDRADAIQMFLDDTEGDVDWVLNDINTKINFAGFIDFGSYVQDYTDRRDQALENGYLVLPQAVILERVQGLVANLEAENA